MNQPSIGLTAEDPGKFVLGTAPVEADGSAHFRLPAGVSVFFQALDAEGRAVQTMRTLTYVQPHQTLACVGCHEQRSEAAPNLLAAAMLREPSRLRPAPDGSWPLRYDRLVQPVLDAQCVRCHKPGGEPKAVAKLDLTGGKSYGALLAYGGLTDYIKNNYLLGRSVVGAPAARHSALLAHLAKGHQQVKLAAEDTERLGRTYQRAARSLRQTIALKADLRRRREAAERAVRPIVVAPVTDEEQAEQDEANDRVEELHDPVGRVIAAAYPHDERRQRETWDRFDREADDWAVHDILCFEDLDEHVLEVCRDLGLPEHLARTWRDLPKSDLFHDPYETDEDDDDPRAALAAQYRRILRGDTS